VRLDEAGQSYPIGEHSFGVVKRTQQKKSQQKDVWLGAVQLLRKIG
jgi:hypothetical protein